MQRKKGSTAVRVNTSTCLVLSGSGVSKELIWANDTSALQNFFFFAQQDSHV
ncbi:hypothetical protein [Nitrosomonas aestuarii]|uniref:hypothetical protein n=1 Tax=Nitrosomonas aestuarii TaxID=52441 RepID=UPI001479847C|nr:hypothetical protein [Nitrosomonas aestuarii]